MELQTVVSQELSKLQKGQALIVSNGPKSGEENLFLEALKSPVIKSSTDEQIKQVLRYVMIKVGLRAPNWPVEEEKQVILQHIRLNYGLHRLEELRLAFDMAVCGKLDLAPEQVVCYENFTCTYISLIMKAYRNWAGEASQYLLKDEPTTTIMNPIDTRGLLQEAYQESSGNNNLYKLFPLHFYDQVVEDGYIHPELFREYLRHAKREICSDIQQQLTTLIGMSREDDQAKIDRYQRQLNEYRAGTRDQEIITRAKQISVWVLFREAKRRKMPALYERVPANLLLQENY